MEKENISSTTENIKEDESSKEVQKEKDLTPFEKIMDLNKLGALFLAADKNDKAVSILSKTLQYYLDLKQKNEIPNFFYSNLY
jgi:hypothetical protein